MAGLSPTELKKRNNFSLFKQRITNRQEFTLTEGKGQKVKIDHRVAGTISSIDDLVNKYSVGKSIILPTAMGQQIRLTQLYKDAAFVGRTQSTTAAEDYQVKVIKNNYQVKSQVDGTISRPNLSQVNHCIKSSHLAVTYKSSHQVVLFPYRQPLFLHTLLSQ